LCQELLKALKVLKDWVTFRTLITKKKLTNLKPLTQHQVNKEVVSIN